MRKFAIISALALMSACGICRSSDKGGAVVWTADNYPAILEVLGSPNIISTNLGPAVEFDGVDDGVFLDSVPVAGMEEFTVELIFKQYASPNFEQRFMHMGEYNGARIMFESRVNPDATWYYDAFVKLDSERSCVLIDPQLTHPCGKWYNLTLVVRKDRLTSYVDGVQQCTGDFTYEPGLISGGKTALGVRQNLVCWFNGAIYKLRVTPKALDPDEFLTDYIELNK